MSTNAIISAVPIVPPVNGWVEATLSKETMKVLRSYIEKSRRPVNEELAGNLSEEMELEDENGYFLTEVLYPLILEYGSYFEPIGDTVPISEHRPFYLSGFWVNKQKKLEFNPTHRHSGIFSFVVWVDIPTDWRDEVKQPFVAASNTPRASSFSMLYSDVTGGMREMEYKMDKSREGTMLLFPANMMHQVYPFYTSDKDRVSISGNIGLKV